MGFNIRIMEKNYSSVVISDVHLGNPYSNWRVLKNFLENAQFKILFLNGDIVDTVYLHDNNTQLSEEESEFLHYLMDIAPMHTYYIVGNHERYLDIIKWSDYGISLRQFFVYDGVCSSAFISHGHNSIFKNFIIDNDWILNIVNSTILMLSRMQTIHKGFIFLKGKFKPERGTEFQILSRSTQWIFKCGLKLSSFYWKRVKKVKYDYGVDYAICGHIHHPEIKKSYMNSGDWVESNSALVENLDGTWNIISWK